MIAVISRVKNATLRVEGEIVSKIGPGLLVYLCAEVGDTPADGEKLAHKVGGLRIFEDEAGKMNLDAAKVGGEFLVVSNFTLAGNMEKGFRPSFIGAEVPAIASPAVDKFADLLRAQGHTVAQGIFGADMQIENTADGPITLVARARDGKVLAW
ncbi:MAG: D-tyrosyl-tRNA(Tyr) deacylase [Clostridia bacterium]|nr:D-tyrosyl-tRNA(Tyr) deacylase [Clostridia bacterium]